MPNIHEPLLVNTIGHSAGAVIFGIFLFLFLKDRSASRVLRGSWLSFSAAGLAFLWDAGSLAALILAMRNSPETGLLIAFSFAMLSMLPAVLLHLSIDGRFPGIAVAGYALSSVAAALQMAEWMRPDLRLRTVALLLIPIGFGILTLLSAVLFLNTVPKSRGNTPRVLGAMGLFIFAISFVHFGSAAPDREWSTELAIHHAGIPLALFVLLQDYRFVLLDAFIRFLANAFLAALLTFVVIRAGVGLILVETHIPRNPLYEAVLLTALCFLLIGFALMRNRLQAWLTRVVFRRPDLEKSLQQIRSNPAGLETEAAYVEWAASHIAGLVRTDLSAVLPERKVPASLHGLDYPALRAFPQQPWAEAVAPLRFSLGDVSYLLLGRRRGGRRYLSEDLAFLSRLSLAVVEQVERFRGSETQRLFAQAELRALQSQIHPHFLFNALNTLYGIIPRESQGARRTVLNLAEIFRYFLRNEKTYISLEKELEIVKAYLEIEHLRLGPRMQTHIDVDEAALPAEIPVLSIQPLVENAVKHGLETNTGPGWLRLVIRAREHSIDVSVENTKTEKAKPAPGEGVGLTNVSRRLQLCYGEAAAVVMDSTAEQTSVRFSIPRRSPVKSENR